MFSLHPHYYLNSVITLIITNVILIAKILNVINPWSPTDKQKSFFFLEKTNKIFKKTLEEYVNGR